MNIRLVETTVGLFILGAIAAFLILAFKVSGFSIQHDEDSYRVTTEFDNIGSLKNRSPVTVAGVKVGQVKSIHLDSRTFKAIVTMAITKKENHIPSDSQASIVTAGLLGANYIELSPGFAEETLHEGSHIVDTQPALQLETMIGQLLFNINKSDSKQSS